MVDCGFRDSSRLAPFLLARPTWVLIGIGEKTLEEDGKGKTLAFPL